MRSGIQEKGIISQISRFRLAPRYTGLGRNDELQYNLLLGNPEFISKSLMAKQFYVYLLASKRNGTLYLGVTSDIINRVWQHKKGITEGFTKKYGVTTLVYYEIYKDAEHAIRREKQLKKWRRAWKLDLIEEKNPDWRDLYVDICQ